MVWPVVGSTWPARSNNASQISCGTVAADGRFLLPSGGQSGLIFPNRSQAPAQRDVAEHMLMQGQTDHFPIGGGDKFIHGLNDAVGRPIMVVDHDVVVED